MGLFSRKPKPAPVIYVAGIRIIYLDDIEMWSFTYRDVDFHSHGTEFHLPAVERLDEIVQLTGQLMPEMLRRCREAGEEWPENSDRDASEWAALDRACKSIHLDKSPGESFSINWSGLDCWGDMIPSFRVSNGTIVEETWDD